LTVTVARTLTRDWSIDLRPYRQRYAWHRHQTYWPTIDATRYSHLIDALGKVRLLEPLPLASPAELADPDGATAYQHRFHAWLTHWWDRIDTTKATAAPLIAELEQLLPCPFPVGSPTGRHADSTNFIPDTPSEQEVQRIERLLILGTEQLAHRFRRGQGISTQEVARRICRVLSAPPSAFIPWHARAGGSFPPEAIGLDPAFWRSITLSRTRLLLSTNTFTLRP
jgi:hypothetical protein